MQPLMSRLCKLDKHGKSVRGIHKGPPPPPKVSQSALHPMTKFHNLCVAGAAKGKATLSIEPKDQVILAHTGDTLVMNCLLTGLQQADQVWHVPWDFERIDDPEKKERFTTQWTGQGVLQLTISPVTEQDAGSYQCHSAEAGLTKTVLVWIPGPDPKTSTFELEVCPISGCWRVPELQQIFSSVVTNEC